MRVAAPSRLTGFRQSQKPGVNALGKGAAGAPVCRLLP
jgi:hypothetical protein